MAAISSGVMAIRCSAETAPSRAASSAALLEVNSSACILILKPRAAARPR